MTDMKCPFCGQELQEDVGYDGDYSCPNCRQPYFGSPELWQELIRTRKALEIAVDSLKLFCGEDVSYYSQSKIDARNARTALEKITALEQKD